MNIGILQIGPLEQEALEHIQRNLTEVFPNTRIEILNEFIPVSQEAFDPEREQYYSSLMLMVVREHARGTDLDKILGVTNVDLYVHQLNFVFGQAESPGKVAVVSLFRLRPEFYRENANIALFLERADKEATHELGHTFGLPHCPDSSCVMSFSNSIHAVDAKKKQFCPKCTSRLLEAMP